MGPVKARARARPKARPGRPDDERAARSGLSAGAAQALMLQRQAGNQAVKQLMKEHGKNGPHKPDVDDAEEDVKQLPKVAGGSVTTDTSPLQRDDTKTTPAGVEYKAGGVTPTFPLDK